MLGLALRITVGIYCTLSKSYLILGFPDMSSISASVSVCDSILVDSGNSPYIEAHERHRRPKDQEGWRQ